MFLDYKTNTNTEAPSVVGIPITQHAFHKARIKQVGR